MPNYVTVSDKNKLNLHCNSTIHCRKCWQNQQASIFSTENWILQSTPITRTILRFPSEFESPGFYCTSVQPFFSLSPLLSHLLKNRFLCQNFETCCVWGLYRLAKIVKTLRAQNHMIDERVDVNCQNWPIIRYIKILYIGNRFETIHTGFTSPSILRLQRSFPYFGRYHLISTLHILLPQYHSTGFAVKGAATLRANGATGSLQVGKNLQGAGDRRRFVHFIWQRRTSAMFGQSQRYVWKRFWYFIYPLILPIFEE